MFEFYSSSGRHRPEFFLAAAFCTLLVMQAAVPLAATAQTSAAPEQSAQTDLPRIRLEINGRALVAEVAIDAKSHQRGLMFREHLGRDEGMLFLFADPFQPCFWMKNTPLPLTIAFIDSDGVIVNLADMAPYSLDAHCAIAPVRYALEVNQGWFARNGAGPGTAVTGLPRLRQR